MAGTAILGVSAMPVSFGGTANELVGHTVPGISAEFLLSEPSLIATQVGHGTLMTNTRRSQGYDDGCDRDMVRR